MNFAHVARVLAGFTVFFTLAQLVPLLLALTEAPDAGVNPLAGFAASLGIGGAVAVILGLAGRSAKGQIFRKEAIAVAGLSWLLASVLGAIPFQWSGLLPNPVDAVFETASGLTTCGATVLGSTANPAPEAVHPSLLLWRSLVQWIGGIGIVLVFVALLPAMGITGKNLLTAEASGVGSESYQPRALTQARTVVVTYVGLTAACVLLLWTVGGMGPFDAICQAFTCLATGGYSTRTSIAHFHSLPAEIVLTVFMFLAGCSIALLAATLRHRGRDTGTLWRSAEFRCYAAFCAGVVVLLTIDLMRVGKGFGPALREASFNAISVITSTGFAISDFHGWPAMSLLLLFLGMVVGGCSGSTAGGIKQVRMLVCGKLLAYSLRHFVRPKSVERLKLEDEVLPAATVSAILALVLLWLIVVLIGGLAIGGLEPRMDFMGAFTASASMVGNCGPAMTAIVPGQTVPPEVGVTLTTVGVNIGPLGSFGDLRDATKAVMSFLMILGRLELLTLLALFTPGFWRH